MDDDAPAVRPVDTGAILGLVLGFGCWPVGIVLSVRALRRIRRTGAAGRDLARVGLAAGIVVGLVTTAYLLWLVLVPRCDLGWYAYSPLSEETTHGGSTLGGICRW